MGSTRLADIKEQNSTGLSAPIGPGERMWIRAYRQDAWRAQGRLCCYCLEPLEEKDVTADHVRARARGGMTGRSNIAAACEPCNLAKGSRTELRFKRLIRSPGPEASMPLLWANARWRIWSRTRRAEQRLALGRDLERDRY